jgi:hypothetical protein
MRPYVDVIMTTRAISSSILRLPTLSLSNTAPVWQRPVPRRASSQAYHCRSTLLRHPRPVTADPHSSSSVPSCRVVPSPPCAGEVRLLQ